jgi:hypothetical protein
MALFGRYRLNRATFSGDTGLTGASEFTIGTISVWGDQDLKSETTGFFRIDPLFERPWTII